MPGAPNKTLFLSPYPKLPTPLPPTNIKALDSQDSSSVNEVHCIIRAKRSIRTRLQPFLSRLPGLFAFSCFVACLSAIDTPESASEKGEWILSTQCVVEVAKIK
ncbi:hypothetical protein CDAR_69861 [Caerostris darwini]|uniref:Uncharacterized protein n=1 Tax=Caerostris darwini TaxID=1538125 RepID=A0AAV4T115_9ARAC|nr:hypothetical protein CDAR_69861 [Caerostris darwini]